MFVGHFGIAELGKGLRRELPLVWLLVAAYLPDIVRVPMVPLTTRHELYSHSIPIVAGLALAIAVIWLLLGGRSAGALVLAVACLLHWPADVFTGCKPTTLHGPYIGFISYRYPINDLVGEGALVILGWLFARRRGVAIRKRWLLIGVVAQVSFLAATYWDAEFFIGKHEWMWRPAQSLKPTPHVLEDVSCRGSA